MTVFKALGCFLSCVVRSECEMGALGVDFLLCDLGVGVGSWRVGELGS